MTEKAAPTITLAELYENQDQYIDALVIYKNLNKENPTEELQNKIAELKDKIFKENTLEYSTIIDKIFTEEEKRLFHILPHEQYKAYKESQADLRNDETYPEELTAIEEEINPEKAINLETEDEASEIDDSAELAVETEVEEMIEIESTINIDSPVEESIEEQDENQVPEIEEIPETNDLETLDVDNKEEPEETIVEEAINAEDTLDKDVQLEDDISLEINDMIPDEIEKAEAAMESDTSTEDVTSIEEIMKKKTDDQNEIIENEENEPANKLETEIDSQDDNHILELLTSLSKMRPDIVERVLKENIGSDASLAEIKLSDLYYVVELLKVSENVERD